MEGEFDAMLLDQEAGDLVGVATLGSASMRAGGRWLWYLAPVKQIYVAYDLDQPRAAGRGGSGRPFRARLTISPLDSKDLTAMHQTGHDLRAWLRYQLAPLETAIEERASLALNTPEEPTPVALWDFDLHPWDLEMARLVTWFRRASFPDGPWELGARGPGRGPGALSCWRSGARSRWGRRVLALPQRGVTGRPGTTIHAVRFGVTGRWERFAICMW